MRMRRERRYQGRGGAEFRRLDGESWRDREMRMRDKGKRERRSGFEKVG